MVSTRPATGVRFTCTLNTFMKMLMQVLLSPVIGSGRGSTRTTFPSAGHTATSGSVGTTRFRIPEKVPGEPCGDQKNHGNRPAADSREHERTQTKQKKKGMPSGATPMEPLCMGNPWHEE